MHTTLTSKGQVTIPADIRKQLGLEAGDQVEFIKDDGKFYIVRKENRIEAAFGLFKAKKSVTLEEMDKAIEEGWTERARR